MNIILTGSLGHISKPLAELLIAKGHKVTIITSDPGKAEAIEQLGATPAVGNISDSDFLTKTFKGADLVYCMIPPNHYYDQTLNLHAYVEASARNYAEAIKASGVKRVIHLSSIGAHLATGTGLITSHHLAENILREIPGITLTHMRPTSFHYNLYSFIPAIKYKGEIAANYGEDDMVVWVAPVDIATAIADEIELPAEGNKIRYVASDELTCNQVAKILGEAIGKAELKWTLITEEETKNILISAGLNPVISAGLAEMQTSMHSGVFFEDYFKNRPALGATKMTTFAGEFAAAYHNS